MRPIRAQQDPDLYNVRAGVRPPRVRQPKEPRKRPLLTRRQIEVLGLMAEGLVYKEIAVCLRISVNTVRNHEIAIYDALGPRTAAGAVAKALRTGLLT